MRSEFLVIDWPGASPISPLATRQPYMNAKRRHRACDTFEAMTDGAAAPLAANREATEAWNGPLYERWIAFRDIVTAGLAWHGEAALTAHPPPRGGRTLDIGCGLGDTTLRLAELVGPDGHAHGIDVAERMIDTAAEEAREAGVENASFAALDVQAHHFEQTYDYAFSRFGTMFFASPVAALRNVRAALRPGAVLNIVVWRRKLDNGWLHRAEQVVERHLDEPEESDEPTCGPGPFSMQNADTVTDVLLGAGFGEIELRRCDHPIKIGHDLDHAVAYAEAIARPPSCCGCGGTGQTRSGRGSRLSCARRWPSSSPTTASSARPRAGWSAPGQAPDAGRPDARRSAPPPQVRRSSWYRASAS
jgi:SAM-dependent methyltransferase